MKRQPTSGYVRSAAETVDRGCEHCQWYAVADSYPELIKRYHDHLREVHHEAWVRS